MGYVSNQKERKIQAKTIAKHCKEAKQINFTPGLTKW
jgi:hypothetical protein